jgi:hypothetical protein
MKMKSKLTQLALSLTLALAAGSATAAGNDLAHPLAAGPGVAATQAAKFTPAQLAEMQARVDLANTIVKNVAADAVGKDAPESWRVGLLSSLYNAPSASLRNIAASATTLDQAHALAATAVTQAHTAASQAKALGSTTSDLTYVPKTPCRFIDTRVVGGAITTPRDFDTFNFGPTYGGAAGCTLPGSGELAFMANVTIVVPAGSPGYIGIRPYGNTTVTSFINWEASGTTGLANAGVVTTAINGSSHYAFNIFEGGGNSPQVILDYFGYFQPATPTALTLTTGTGDTFSVPANFSAYHYTTATCPSGYTAVSTYCWNQDNTNIYSTGHGLNGGAWCGWKNVSSTTAYNVSQNVFCAQVP